ncbi:MAG: hypothetical protein ACYC26_04945 [Phycisphaerales bacterium]
MKGIGGETCGGVSGAGRLHRVLLAAAFGLLCVLGVLLGWHRIISPDMGFHLSLARWSAQHGRVPMTDPLTYTVPGNPCVNMQWLSDLLVYGMYQRGGAGLIEASTIAATLGFGTLLLFRAFRRNGRVSLSGLLLLLLFFLGNFWEPRPHLLSWIFGSLILLILEEHARGGRRWLWLLPVIMLLWVNSHSLFMLGPVIMGTYVFSHVVVGRSRSRPIDRRLLIWCAIAVLVIVVNPYHIRGILFPFGQLGDIQNAGIFKSTQVGTAEFLSPFSFGQYFIDGWFVPFQSRLYWQMTAVFVVIGWIGGLRRWSLFEWLVGAGFAYAFSLASKNFGYFIMAVFPMASAGLDDVGRYLALRLGGRPSGSDRPSTIRQTAWSGGGCVLIALLIAAVGSGRLNQTSWMLDQPGEGFNTAILPVNACKFIETHHIEGRLLNSWDDGGYIAWATGQKVFIYSNGDFMGPEFYAQYVRSREPGGLEAAIAQWKPTVAVVPYKLIPYWLYYFHHARDWRMVFADEYAAVFLHKSVSPRIAALPRPKAGEDYPTYDPAQAEAIIRRAAGAPARGVSGWFLGSRGYPRDTVAKAGFYLQTGELDACIGTCLEGLDRTAFRVPDLMLTLGHALNARRLYSLADVCFDTFLRSDDEPVIRREIEAARRRRR